MLLYCELGPSFSSRRLCIVILISSVRLQCSLDFLVTFGPCYLLAHPSTGPFHTEMLVKYVLKTLNYMIQVDECEGVIEREMGF